MTDLNKYRNDLLDILKQEAKDLWGKKEDPAFLKEIAEDITKQRVKLKTAGTEKEKEKYKKNLNHLITQIEGRIALKKNKLIKKGDVILQKMVNVTIKLIINSLDT